jgi:adenine-specific DNA-methyltransferase
VPKDGRAWPIPRLQEDARAIKLVNGSTFRLKDYGYRARVGSYVDYRERQTKRIYYKIPQRPGETLYPLIWSSDISSQGWLQLGRHSNHAQPRYIRVSDTSRDTLLMRPSIALQRVTSSDQPKRLVGAVVPPGLLRRYGGAIGENHVLFLEQMTDEVKVAPALLAQILRASIIDRYFRCISGAANVSVFELNQLPLPDPELVRKELGGRCSVNDALVRAFGKQQSHEQR